MGIHAVEWCLPINEYQIGDAKEWNCVFVIGSAINTEHTFCIAKVPKRATSAEQVKQELVKRLEKL